MPNMSKEAQLIFEKIDRLIDLLRREQVSVFLYADKEVLHGDNPEINFYYKHKAFKHKISKTMTIKKTQAFLFDLLEKMYEINGKKPPTNNDKKFYFIGED